MTKTKEQIIENWKRQHEILTRQYYQDKTLSRDIFERRHADIWRDMEAELQYHGYGPPPIPAYDLAARIDQIEARLDRPGLLKRLGNRVKGVK